MTAGLNHSPEFVSNISNLVELLSYRAVRQPESTAYTFLVDGETAAVSLTYQQLEQSSRAIAFQLHLLGATGERALLLYPPGLEFISAFFGCLFAGVVAVPAYPPPSNQNLSRLQAIVASSQAKVALTTTPLLTSIEGRLVQNPELAALHWLATDNITSELGSDWQKPELCENTLAFLQYTSGSTGTPKGVMVSHGNLLHNSALIHKCFEHTPNSRGVIWLPPYHDMGLIGGVLQPIYGGFPVTLMSPAAFLQKPVRWLQAISRSKATTSGGPNFAYDLCVRKMTPEQQASLDLSSWEVAFNGSEPVRGSTLERFATTFESCGFRREAFYPCYGMAEATLFVSGGLKTAPPVVLNLEETALEQKRVVAARGKGGRRAIVGLGRAWLEEKIAIVDPESLTQCSVGQVGEIWVSGASVAQGYWHQPEETKQTFQAYLADTGEGPFLRTGDLGFLQNDELFVTGRIKDMIIIRGRNYYPQDIELTVEESHPALRPSCGAAFAVEVDGEERLVVAQELERSYLRKLDADEVVWAIQRAVSKQHELQVYAVLLLKTASIPKTSSGKIQCHACRARFLDGSLNVIASRILEDKDSLGSEHVLTREALLAIAPQERQQHLEFYMQELLARRLKIDKSQLNPQQPLNHIGLDSLALAESKNEIEVDLGVNVPVVKLLEGASIANFAMQVIHQLTPEHSIPSSGTKQPFFCVHPVMGTVSAYYDLARLLGKEQPFYGLEAVGINGEEPPLTSIEEIAARYIKGIRMIQPEGPYFLGGWSFGSLVAFEMAQQLQRSGQTVALLAVIDTPPTSADTNKNFFKMAKLVATSIVRDIIPFVNGLIDHIVITTPNPQQPQQEGQKTQKAQDKFNFLIEQGAIPKAIKRESRMKLLFPAWRHLNPVINANQSALIKYVPQVYPGRITLFRTGNPSGKNLQEETLGWSELTQAGVEIYYVPGHHLNLVELPHVQVLAQKLKVCLEQAHTKL